MPLDREITRPMLGTDQEPTSITWKSSLRSPVSSPRGPSQTQRSRSRTRSSTAALQSSMRSRTPSPLNKSLNNSTSNLRKSQTGKLSTSFSKSAELKEIESDYVKNLQQQVYFLELEANYLREQAKKATAMHPQMTSEAERMLAKLRVLQSENDGLELEVRRKEASLDIMNSEKQKVLDRLIEEENLKERLKRTLQEEISQVKHERDRITLENAQLDNQVERLLSEKENISSKLRESQNIIASLRDQMSERSETLRSTQLSLEEKRSQCAEAELRSNKVEEHYLNVTQKSHDRQINEYKNELRSLRQQLKEQERQADDERFIKNKTQDENEQMRKTNILLQQQIDDLTNQFVKEQDLRNELENNRTEDMVEITMLSDREKELKTELRTAHNELIAEKDRCDRYLAQIRKQEGDTSVLESTNNSTRMQLVTTEARLGTLEKENSNLRKDKDILTDHVADLQRQLSQRSVELTGSRREIKTLEKSLELVETEKRLDESAHSEKWREFENLADGMKKLSRTMAQTTNPTRSSLSSSVKFS